MTIKGHDLGEVTLNLWSLSFKTLSTYSLQICHKNCLWSTFDYDSILARVVDNSQHSRASTFDIY